MSDIRFNQWLHQSGTGGVSQSDGGHVGIGTTNPLIPVGAGNTHILNVGVVTCNNISAGSSITATGNIYADNYFGNSGLTLNNNANVSVNLTSTSTSGSSRIFFGDPDNSLVGRLLYSHNGDYMSFYTAGAERARITSSGNIGAGTNNPDGFYTHAKNLVIGSGSSGEGITIFSGSSDSGYIGFNDTVSNGMQGFIQYNHNGDYMAFGPNGTEKVRIDSSGRLLIGTTTEGRSGADQLTIASSGHAGITIRSGTSSDGQIFFSDATSGTSEYQGYIFYSHGDENLVFGTSADERLRIDSDGRLIQRYSAEPYANRAATFQCPAGQGQTYIAVVNTETNGSSGILFGDHAGQNAGNFDGYINYSHQYQMMQFMVNAGNERFRIASQGQLGVGGANYGTSGQVLTSQGASAAPQWASVSAAAGSVFDTWHGQGFSGSAGNGYITSGWGRPGGPGGSWANGGSGKQTSQSSGIFSFPSTGIYYVSFQLGGYAQNVNNRIIGNRIYATNSNANPPAHEVAHGQFNVKSFSGIDNGVGYGLAICECILRITNTSNDKVAFWWQSEDNYNLGAGTDQMAIFYKLADL